MRNLYYFLNRFRVFLIFALFQATSLFLYFTFFNFPKTQYLTSASYVIGTVLTVRNDVTKHFNLSKTNTKLQEENARLHEMLPRNFISIDTNYAVINDTFHQRQFKYIPAIVINSTFDKRNNFFTLNVGKAQGISRGMGVFSDLGIVGIIHNVSENFSVVKSVLTENINIDVMVQSSGAFGLLKWDGSDARFGSISGISNDIKVNMWSKVVTRGGSAIFPRGLPVGKIAKIGSIEGKPLWDIKIRFYEDFRKIQRVYVIKNILKDEQKELEYLIPVDKKKERW
jgi:rod shape-determining protein MreC